MNFTSTIRLIADPERYHGESVRVVGFLSQSFEVCGLFVSESDHVHAVTKNAIWLELATSSDTERLNHSYVVVEGFFDAHSHGHLGMWSGTIRDISRVGKWR